MLAKFSIKKPVTTIMCILVVVLGGILAYMNLGLDLMPSMEIPIAIVSTTYAGAGPEEMESIITKPIEEALGTVSNIDTISSTSSAGSSMVMIQFEDGTNIDLAAVDMREKVDLIKGSLPDGASEPMVMKIDMDSMTAIYLGIKSESLNLTELNTLTEDTLIQRFEKIEGIASVSVMGGLEEEVQILINPEKMQGYGVTTGLISQALAAENINYPVGSVQQGTISLQVKSEGKFQSVDDIRNLPLVTPTGAIIAIRDVADVDIVVKEQDSFVTIDGEAALALVIQKQSNANLVDISDKVVNEMNKVANEFSEIETSMLSDTSSYIKTSVSNITSTAFQAALLAILVIFVFLRSTKMSLIVGISIPTSILATFAAMWFSDMTLNMISMGGIAIGIGMLVDNSIVVLENIYTHMRTNPDPKSAAAEGTNEVAMAVAASTLTTMGVFVPLMFVTGTIGDLFADLSMTVCFSLLASLVVSLTFVPMACSKLLKPELFQDGKEGVETKHFGKILDKWTEALHKLDNFYHRVLEWSLIHKKIVVAAMSAFFIATMSLILVMGFDLMPDMDEGVVAITIEMPKGSVLEETEAMTWRVFEEIGTMPEVDNYYAIVGSMGGMMGGSIDSAQIGVNLVPKNERSITSKDFATQLEAIFSDYAGCEITASASSMAMGSYGDTGVTLRITGDDSDTLREIVYELEERLSTIDGVTSVTNSAGEVLQEAKVVINRAKASTYGLTTAQLSNAISGAINGSVATQYKVDGTEIDVRIKYDKDSVKYLKDIENLTVTTASGLQVPITEVADIVMDESSASITRNNHHKYIDVTAVVYGREMSVVQTDVDNKLKDYVLPDGYAYETTGTLDTMNESFSQLIVVLIVAVLLVYMIMASQFESLIYPFIIMFSIPIALSGGVLGLFVTGKSITITSFMGFIMLVGMVVNNAIVLVDAANQNVEKGMTSYEAISKAGPDRLRPILMTTLTTVFGMVPMGLGIGEGMEMQQPMAITIIFGLTLSTIVTLVLVPVLYLLVDKYRIKNIKKRRAEKKEKKAASMNA